VYRPDKTGNRVTGEDILQGSVVCRPFGAPGFCWGDRRPGAHAPGYSNDAASRLETWGRSLDGRWRSGGIGRCVACRPFGAPGFYWGTGDLGLTPQAIQMTPLRGWRRGVVLSTGDGALVEASRRVRTSRSLPTTHLDHRLRHRTLLRLPVERAPKGCYLNSLGREPQVRPPPTHNPAPKGRHTTERRMPPLRGSRVVGRTGDLGLTPQAIQIPPPRGGGNAPGFGARISAVWQHRPGLRRQRPPLARLRPRELRHAPFELQHGPCGLQHGPLQLRHGPLQLRHGPLELRSSPRELRHSPLQLRHGPFELRCDPRELRDAIGEGRSATRGGRVAEAGGRDAGARFRVAARARRFAILLPREAEAVGGVATARACITAGLPPCSSRCGGSASAGCPCRSTVRRGSPPASDPGASGRESRGRECSRSPRRRRTG
jgi:hypothetical protein